MSTAPKKTSPTPAPAPAPSVLPNTDSVFTIPKETVFLMPKDTSKGDKIVWTSQAEELLKELTAVIENDTENRGAKGIFILSGPSGIGKSCMALSIALKMKNLGRPVLYVSDAHQLLLDAKQHAQTFNSHTTVEVSKALINLFQTQNEVPLDCSGRIAQSRLIESLSEIRTVVIIDEQGKAFSEIQDSNNDLQCWDFPFLYPESYTTHGRNVLVLLTGSNQQSFETQLNSAYSGCVRYVQPLTPKEAECIVQAKVWDLTADDTLFYCNNVPREMRLLEAWGVDQYVVRRKEEMYHSLGVKVGRLPDERAATEQLAHLFNMRQMSGATIPFQDIGLVYRKRNPRTYVLEAFPLCRPAEMALIDTWRRLRPSFSLKTLNECIQESDGVTFELLVYDKFLSDFVGRQNTIPCVELGKDVIVSPTNLKIDSIYTATCSNVENEVVADLCSIRKLAESRDITILYRCPKGSKTMDFCIVSPTSILPIQVSLKLTEHTKPDPEFLEKIGACTPPGGVKGCNWSFIYVTTKPEKHARIAEKPMWFGVEVAKIRLIDATTWLS